MALVDLAGHSNGRPVALADISGRQEISLSYLEQLFAKLRRAGLVKSVRGPGGGYLLARSAEDTRISDAIMAVDEPIRATRCKPNSGTGCHSDKSRCLTHDLWEELSHQIHLFLNSVSLADVCEKRVLGRSGAVKDGVDTVITQGPNGSGPANGSTPSMPGSNTPVAAE
jgi:Rrf2 family iron-sulfur cluster assembly transcriptional regulator